MSVSTQELLRAGCPNCHHNQKLYDIATIGDYVLEALCGDCGYRWRP